MSYNTVASVLRQCDSLRSTEGSMGSSQVVSASASSATYGNRSKRTLTPEQLADLKSKSQCRKCKKFGHWKGDHLSDGTLKPGVKSTDSPIPAKSN